MKIYLILFIFLAASLLSAEVTEDINGYWLSQSQEAVIEIYSREGLTFGRIAWLEEPLEEDGEPKMDDKNPDPARRQDLILGLEILKDFQADGNKWKGGTIYDPETGKTYSSHMKLKDDNLHLRGYIGISLLGRTEVWTRLRELPGQKD
ncbi:MAG: DUF2147 domain-containing protein [Candidatus Cloacimonetes bacterium]|nr:DUF2147 domain-containing protein [Candidatus Cloacimonadota bacterium]